MHVSPIAGRIAATCGSYIADFQSFFGFHKIETGRPECFLRLASLLASKDSLRADFFRLAESIRSRDAALSDGDILTIVALALGGPGMGDDGEVAIPQTLLSMFRFGMQSEGVAPGNGTDSSRFKATERGSDQSRPIEAIAPSRAEPETDQATTPGVGGAPAGEERTEAREGFAEPIPRTRGTYSAGLEALRREGNGHEFADLSVGSHLTSSSSKEDVPGERVVDPVDFNRAEMDKMELRLHLAEIERLVSRMQPPTPVTVPHELVSQTHGSKSQFSGELPPTASPVAEAVEAMRAADRPVGVGATEEEALSSLRSDVRRLRRAVGGLGVVLLLLIVGGAFFAYRRLPIGGSKAGGPGASAQAGEARVSSPDHGVVPGGTPPGSSSAASLANGAGVGGAISGAKSEVQKSRRTAVITPVPETKSQSRPAVQRSIGPPPVASRVAPQALTPGTSTHAATTIGSGHQNTVNPSSVPAAEDAGTVRSASQPGGSANIAPVTAPIFVSPAAGGGGEAAAAVLRPVGPVSVANDSAMRNALNTPRPYYPFDARIHDIEGKVTVEVLISKKGTVETARAVEGPPALRASAIEAVRSWRFKPYQLNGQPAEVRTDLNIVFSLH